MSAPHSPALMTLTFTDIDGQEVPLKRFAGRVLCIVNVASRCGFTPQYAGLERLHQDYAGRGLTVIGFPCNQFGGQEPGADEEIKSFCQVRFGVTFALSAKVDVNGPGAHPIYQTLCRALPGLLGIEAIKWNFTKFLVGHDGTPLSRHGPRAEPASLAPHLERALAARPPAGDLERRG